MPSAEPDWVARSQLKKRKPRHGFKADANRRTAALRAEHGCSAHGRIDCLELAQSMGITVVRLSDLDDCDAVHRLTSVDPSSFSAATLRHEHGTAILLNDAHSPERQASNLAHEIGHIVLEHQDAPPLSDAGCREIDAVVEVEADIFGSILLVPEQAVLRYARAGKTIEESAEALGVSTQMMRWRHNMCGASKRVQRR